MTDTDRLLGWCDNRAVLDPWTRARLRDIDDVHRHIADLAAEIRRLRARPCPHATAGDRMMQSIWPTKTGGDTCDLTAGPAPTGDDLSYDAVTANRLLGAYRRWVADLETLLADTGDFITAIGPRHLKPERDALLERIDALEAIDRAPTGDAVRSYREFQTRYLPRSTARPETPREAGERIAREALTAGPAPTGDQPS